jgi:hypothetical protein
MLGLRCVLTFQRAKREEHLVRTGLVAAVVIAVLGITGGIAYAALPNTSSGPAGTAALPFLHTAVSPEVRGTASRKQAKATCPTGEAVASGGYLVTGPFQGRSKPKAAPAAIESVPSLSASATLPNQWTVTAVAPSIFTGAWTLKAYALCG